MKDLLITQGLGDAIQLTSKKEVRKFYKKEP